MTVTFAISQRCQKGAINGRNTPMTTADIPMVALLSILALLLLVVPAVVPA